jgi:hypothetical protein
MSLYLTRLKFGHPHPKREGWRFYCYRKTESGKRKAVWVSPECFENLQKNFTKQRKTRAERLKTDPEFRATIYAKNLRWSRKNVAKLIFLRARGRAKELGLPFDLQFSDVVIPEKCPALGIPLVCGEAKKVVDGSPSLDRIVPELGYVKGNVVVVSHKANTMKNSATVEELCRVAQFYKNLVESKDM